MNNFDFCHKVAVLGIGHVGLPTALSLAEMGHCVVAADQDRDKVALIQGGHCPFYEPGLQELLERHRGNERFQVTSDVPYAIRSASILFICVGTPQKSNGEADLTEVEALARLIAANLNSFKLVVEKSTVPAITGEWIGRTLARYHGGAGKGNGKRAHAHTVGADLFEVASNPEFLQEGRAVQDCLHPDRIVCGVSSERARQMLAELYSSQTCPILFTDVNTAELIKHTANAFLATKISFINIISDLCETVGANANEVARGIGMDPRIGPAFLRSGIGFGGYCLPKDLRAFIHLAEQNHIEMPLLSAAERINRSRIDRFLKKVREAVWVIRGKQLAVLGLAFKGGTDDIRESPAIHIVQALLAEGAHLRLYDPAATENAKALLALSADALTYCSSAYDAVRETHALLILTDWDEFRGLNLARIRKAMQVPVIVDGRNVLEPGAVARAGFEYWCFGRTCPLYPQARPALPRSEPGSPRVMSSDIRVSREPEPWRAA